VLKWLAQANIETAHIDPGKPWQNGADESFNGKFRDECLTLEWFRSRAEAVAVIETWRGHYNLARPHSSLGYRTPVEFSREQDQRKSTLGGAACTQPVVRCGSGRRNSEGGLTDAEGRAVPGPSSGRGEFRVSDCTHQKPSRAGR
jgi:hypothetical protein